MTKHRRRLRHVRPALVILINRLVYITLFLVKIAVFPIFYIYNG